MQDDRLMYPVQTWNDAVVTSSTNLFTGIAEVIPSLIGAIVIIILGWILAALVKSFTKRVLDIIHFDHIASRVGVDKFLHQAGFPTSPKEAASELLRWFVIITFVLAGLSILGIPAVNDVLTSIVDYIPKVIAAVFILAGGLLLANFLSDVLRGSLRSMNLSVADTLAGVAKWMLIVFTVLAVIRQLEIVPDLVNIIFMGIVGGVALGFGLMIGLGGKDVANDVFRDWYNRLKRQ